MRRYGSLININPSGYNNYVQLASDKNKNSRRRREEVLSFHTSLNGLLIEISPPRWKAEEKLEINVKGSRIVRWLCKNLEDKNL